MNDFAGMAQKFDARNGGIVEFGDDSRLFIEFYSRAVPDEVASREASRPISRQMDYIRIRQPGERDEIDRPAHNGDQRRFARHWAAYQDGRQAVPDGTPLALLFPNHPEIVENLKYFKVFVAEQLANFNDTQIQNIGMGGRAWQQKAAEFLMLADSGKGLEALSARLDQMEQAAKAKDDKIAALEAALAEKSEERRGSGRPPKAAAAA